MVDDPIRALVSMKQLHIETRSGKHPDLKDPFIFRSKVTSALEHQRCDEKKMERADQPLDPTNIVLA